MTIPTPSPKVSVFLVIVVILATATIIVPSFFNLGQNNKGDAPVVDLSIKNELDQKLGNTDSDGDKLPDWQEEIWGTDKNNPDTDGDGTSDGEEVNQNRNPLVAGPDDALLSNEQLVSDYTPSVKTDPNSLTSILSKNLLLRVAQVEQLQNSGDTSGNANIDVAAELAQQAIQEVQIPDKYPLDIFLTFDGNDSTKLQNYADSLITIQKQALQTVSPDNQELDPLINAFKNIAGGYSKLAVPKDVVATHSKITNNYYIAAEALINLKISDSDPVLGLLSIPIYKKVSAEQPVLYGQIETYLKSSGIILNN